MGPGSDGPLGAMAGMEPHHMNGSLGNKPRKRAHLLFKRTTKAFFSPFKQRHVFHPVRFWRHGRNEQGKSRRGWSRVFLLLNLMWMWTWTRGLAELLLSELPKQFKWHQQSSRDTEGRRRAEWKLPPLLPERERECPSSARHCCKPPPRRANPPRVPPQYSPTMTMSVWPPLLLNSRLCHHSKDLISTQDTAKHISTESGTRRHFGSSLIFFFFFFFFENADRKAREGEGGREREGDDVADDYTLETWRTISLFITESQVWQNQLLKNKQKKWCIHDTFSTQNPPPLPSPVPRPFSQPPPPPPPFPERRKKIK